MLDSIEMGIMTTKFEFLASTAKAKTDYFPMETPRRYTYGKPSSGNSIPVMKLEFTNVFWQVNVQYA